MKNLFDGMKRAKARTILSVLIVFVMTVSIGVCSYTISSPMMHGRGENAPDMKMTQNFDNSTTDVQAAPTDENADSEAATDNAPAISDNKDKGQGKSLSIIIISAILVIGIVLLFAVNFASTKKRNNEFKQILSNGVPFKAIKKQLFLEAFVIVLIAGIVGGGIGVAIAQPVSNTVMSQRMANGNENTSMPDGFEGGKPQGDFNPDNKPDNIPEDFNPDNKSENMPEDFNPDNKPDNMPERPSDNSQTDNDNSVPQDNFRGNRQGNTAEGYIISAIITAVSAVVSAIVSGIACYLPIKKINSKETINE